MKAKSGWLLRTDSNVALKVINMGINAQEFIILQHLQYSSLARDYAHHPGRHSVIQLFDHFDISTSHRKTARSAPLQAAMGFDYLWKCSIAHGGGCVLAYCEWHLLIIFRFTLKKRPLYHSHNLSTFKRSDYVSLRATNCWCSQETRWSELSALNAVLSRRTNFH